MCHFIARHVQLIKFCHKKKLQVFTRNTSSFMLLKRSDFEKVTFATTNLLHNFSGQVAEKNDFRGHNSTIFPKVVKSCSDFSPTKLLKISNLF